MQLNFTIFSALAYVGCCIVQLIHYINETVIISKNKNQLEKASEHRPIQEEAAYQPVGLDGLTHKSILRVKDQSHMLRVLNAETLNIT